MATYHFVTIWQIEAPIQQVWDTILDTKTWSNWWPSVESVVDIQPGDANGVGKIQRQSWKTPLSYKLTFETRITRIEPPTLLEVVADGELEGEGLWELETLGNSTLVQYTWKVKTRQMWMNILSMLIRPLLVWNHNQIMRQGGEGLAQTLGARLIKNESN